MDDKNINDLLHQTSGCSVIVLNFMKTFALRGAALCLENAESEEQVEMAEDIIQDVIEGYQLEKHSVQ